MVLLKCIVDFWIPVLTLLFSVVGGFFALQQWRKSNKIRRSEFVHTINEAFRFNDAITQMIYSIDYGEFVYDAEVHKNHRLEERIDALLSTLSYVCYLHESNILKTDEFDFYRFSVVWICKNFHVENYLWNMHHFAEKILVKVLLIR